MLNHLYDNDVSNVSGRTPFDKNMSAQGRNMDLEQIYYLNNIATGGLKPDLTFVFDVDVETAMRRVGSNQDRMEAAGIEFFNRVRQGYLEIAKQEPERIKVIDSSQSIEYVHKKIVEIIKNEYPRFKSKNR